MSRVLIAGCGYVGTALAAMLATDRHEVHGMRRGLKPLPDGAQSVQADVTRPATFTALPRDLDVVVYAVGADERTEKAYEKAYVLGLERLLEFLLGRGDRLQRLVYVSSTGVYGQDDGSRVDESSPTEPADFTGRVLLRGEAVAKNMGSAAVVVRLSGIYGPGRDRLVRRVRQGTGLASSAGLWTNRIHRDDCAGVLRQLAFTSEPEAVYLGTDCEPALQGDVSVWIAKKIGVEMPLRAPDGPAHGKRCSNHRLLSTGYSMLYPTYRDGYATLLGTG